jgi:hypothetical protein
MKKKHREKGFTAFEWVGLPCKPVPKTKREKREKADDSRQGTGKGVHSVPYREQGK